MIKQSSGYLQASILLVLDVDFWYLVYNTPLVLLY